MLESLSFKPTPLVPKIVRHSLSRNKLLVPKCIVSKDPKQKFSVTFPYEGESLKFLIQRNNITYTEKL